jgi:phospholipid transport system substrate-binding protein
MRRAVLTLLISGWILVFSSTANANSAKPTDPNYPNDPGELIRVKWDAVIDVLRDSRLEEDAKAAKVTRIVSPVFDFELMGKLALGRTHWPKLSEAQQKAYVKLFAERLKNSYRRKISLYKDQTITFKPPVKLPNKTVNVPTELLTGDSKYEILYKLRKNVDKWMVYDFEIQGVSILITYRSQFDDILSNNSVEEFLDRLREPPDEK